MNNNEYPLLVCSFRRGDMDDYVTICEQSEGMRRVSDLDIGGFFAFMSLAYHHDHSDQAGIWGFIDTTGKEIIKPQYIFAYDFQQGLARVCKGKWVYKDDWEKERKARDLWSEKMLWGFIDKEGNEIIPCIYNNDEVRFYPHYPFIGLCDPNTKKYGIMGLDGKWVVEPRFVKLDYDMCYENDLFGFYDEYDYTDYDCERNLIGIYSIKEQKVLVEPQFTDVYFLKDGNIEVQIFDAKQGEKIDKIIDRNGQIVHSGV